VFSSRRKQLPVPLGDDVDGASVTVVAVSSSIAYAGPGMPVAHLSASAIVFSGGSS